MAIHVKIKHELSLIILEFITNLLFMLANDFFFQQFFDHSLDISIRSRQSLRLLSLERDVLDSLHLGGRATQTTLVHITIHISHAPLVQYPQQDAPSDR